MRTRLALLLLVTLGGFTGCSSMSQRSLSNAWAQWHHGSKEQAIGLAREELGRYLNANDLTEKEVMATAHKASQVLEETLILDGLAKRAPNPLELLKRGASTLSKELRQDLGSADSLRVMRALQTVASLRLREYALSVLAVVYRRQPYDDKTAFFSKSSPALRSVAVKWVAFETLQEFVSHGPRGGVLNRK